jgi:zona occludens toxin
MPDGSIVHLRPPARLFGHVWDYFTTWKNKDGLGPVLIIDECHVSLPKKDTDPQVIEFFKLHRHFNVDILLITQNFRDIDPQISGLLATVIRVRKADILGKSQSAYLRRVFAGFKGAEISSEQRKYKPEFFALYKSHTQGNSVQEATGSDVSPFIKKFRAFSLAFYALTAAAVVWAFWPSADKPKPVAASKSPSVSLVSSSPVAGPPAPIPGPYHFTQRGEIPPPPVDVPSVKEDPFKGVELHITGFMKSATKSYYAFVVSKNGSRIFDLTLKDLEAAGYKFLPLGDCAGILRFAGKDRPVICDAPAMAAGTNSKPVVIDSSGGNHSDSKG